MSFASLLSVLSSLAELRWDKLRQFSDLLFSWRQARGIYEVLDYQVELELCDAAGHHAIYKKHQEIKFLQDNVMAYSDKAWGEGDIFAEYKCSPGVAVDRYKDGYRWRVLISLREAKHKNDREMIQIERHIRNGFTKSTEYLQTDTDHHIHNLTVTLLFPKERHPKSVRLTEQNSSKGFELGKEHFHELPDNRMKVIWQVKKPRLYGSYILSWDW